MKHSIYRIKNLITKIYIYMFISRQFNVVLREDPFSVFSSDVQIENTLGPLDYDVSRVYTGTLEGKLLNFEIYL